MNNNDIVIDKEQLDIAQTLECGQVFRYRDMGTHYTLRAEDKECILYYNGNNTIIENNDKKYFCNYFDLSCDYDNIKQSLSPLPFMDEAMALGSGIRILRQAPFETLISFIISANNHIPRIKSIIERISGNASFPTPCELAKLSVQELRDMGLGFRDRYVHATSNAIANGEFDMTIINDMPADIANKTLCNLQGIGPKVADCILLFGYHKSDVFPVDTWIKKVFKAKFGDIDDNKTIRKLLIATYGELAGYAQQYLFYAARSKSFID